MKIIRFIRKVRFIIESEAKGIQPAAFQTDPIRVVQNKSSGLNLIRLPRPQRWQPETERLSIWEIA